MTPASPPPFLMAILNVTPDSFYDGGKFPTVEEAVQRALVMLQEGADIIDIGGESTGPGSGEVSSEEELGRVIPVIKNLKFKISNSKLSIDTYKAEAAEAALAAGADMVNDVTAGRGDPRMFEVVAKARCHYVMMRSKDDSPRTTKRDVQYADVMRTIHAFFEERLAAALRAGIRKEHIILDPGLGHFVSADPRYSWEILERLEELSDLGCPILVSPSRKSFTAKTPHEPPSERLPGTLEATRIAVKHGASIIRTHDVGETRKLIDETSAVAQ